ncbi:O-methylsterigmatocystin oxidoreductase [Grifola frondosa]|uniref:O-methylsterigmatocystin oxidoreductase n=1 Tax=Grifola frondosa TaxID=5627 RepID=A0A1C7MHA6_GRIFR|nr:O-methylsterigmatocystin oxidoreductase [Grifola frondosa]
MHSLGGRARSSPVTQRSSIAVPRECNDASGVRPIIKLDLFLPSVQLPTPKNQIHSEESPSIPRPSGSSHWFLDFSKTPATSNGSVFHTGRMDFPPGPPARPIVGNILEVPSSGAWNLYTKLKPQYGDLVYFHGLGSKILVLNSLKAIHDLLDKRGNNYSHRPIFTTLGELMHVDQSMPLLPYGKEWREHRKLAYIALSPSAVKKYHSVQSDISALMNRDFLERPDDFFSHVRLTSGRILLTVTYGLSVDAADNEYITHAEETMELITRGSVPGAFLCDLLPFLKWLPSWTSFQKEVAQGRAMVEHLVTKPFEHVKREMAEGTAAPSLTQDLLRLEPEPSSEFEYRVRWTTGAVYGAGGESTYATVLTFILAMALHPEFQNRAQAEIDRVVGTERMPVVSHRADLPYVAAVIKETMRWHPVVPLAIARRTAEDDVYEGYFIPKGTIVVPNTEVVTLEPNDKYDPHAFLPDRFLDPTQDVVDPAVYAFGYGRRVCPGKALAENSVFLLITGLLTAFDIAPPAEGGLEARFGASLVSYPEPFKCAFCPRSEAKAELVRRRAAQCKV